MSTSSPLQHLLIQLEHTQPRHLLVASANPPSVLSEYASATGAEITQLNPHQFENQHLGRFDFAVVADYLEHLDKATAMAHLGQLRNLHSHRIWVLVDDELGWHFNDFIGLGFQRQASWQRDGLLRSCYGYDLSHYNRVRSWNNPRFWANPENWNKYWW